MMTTQGNFQTQQQPLSISTIIPSEGSSPTGSSLNLISENARRPSSQSSQINLASNLTNLSLGTSSTNLESIGEDSFQTSPIQEHQQQPQYTVKIKNIPSDITLREAHCIFAFAKDFISLDLLPDSNNLPVIFARFKSLAAASTYSQILESNQIFGPTYPFYLKAEILDNSIIQPPIPQLSLGSSSKRPSIGGQRSRFLFSDPFNNEPIQETVDQTSGSSNQQQISNPNNSNGVGKSLLLMESQQDAREYEQLVRDPWQQSSSNSTSQQHPQTILASSQPNSAVSLNGTSNSFNNSQPQTPGVEWERRRQGSVFFNNQSPLLTSQIASSNQIPSQLSLTQQLPQPSSQPLAQPIVNSTTLQHPASAPASQSSSNSQIIPPLNPPQSQQVQIQIQSQQSQIPSSVQSALNSSQQSSQVDLSLLARVPPPANPADQNPPCNTLYVGNLPPDATEGELRQLFAPQRGFRRLSFRTKQQPLNGNGLNTNIHSHGPMCFVEFEDVAHATRALAELYGRTLPRPGGVPGKGGIRLSFSKNPLGVRGPGQRRSSSFAYQSGFKN